MSQRMRQGCNVVYRMLIFLILLTHLNAQSDDCFYSTQNTAQYTKSSAALKSPFNFYDFNVSKRLDNFQQNVSYTVKYLSSKTDEFLAPNSQDSSNHISSFFLKDDFYDKTNKSYMIYSYGYSYGAYEKLKNINNIKMKIDLPKTQKKLRLVIDGEYNEDLKSVSDEGRTSLALEYIFPFFNTTFRAGIKGSDNTFLSAKVGFKKDYKLFIFQPIQYFECSSKDHFSEKTKLYFDKPLKQNRLLEILLSRSTQSHTKGTELFAGVFYNIIFKNHKGLTYEISTTAETQIQEYDEHIIFHRIKATWRQQIYKKYLFINISPFLQYHRKYDFKNEPFFEVYFDIKFN
jgi:hypothetical protein